MDLIQSLAQAVDELEEDKAASLSEEAVSKGLDIGKVLLDGVMEGLARVNRKLETKEYFLAEMITAGEVGKRCMDILTPHLPKMAKIILGKVVIGVVKDDMHELGKNLVAAQLRMAGFEVHDLGIDVPTPVFIEKAEEVRAHIIGMSGFLSTTTPNFNELISYLKDSGMRSKYKVIVGGGTTTARFAEYLGVDGWAPSAVEAVGLCKRLMGK